MKLGQATAQVHQHDRLGKFEVEIHADRTNRSKMNNSKIVENGNGKTTENGYISYGYDRRMLQYSLYKQRFKLIAYDRKAGVSHHAWKQCNPVLYSSGV